jgi:hypothetical protein
MAVEPAALHSADDLAALDVAEPRAKAKAKANGKAKPAAGLAKAKPAACLAGVAKVFAKAKAGSH